MSGVATGATGAAEGGLTPAELRSLFLFEHLTEDQLAVLARAGSVRAYEPGALLFREGEPAQEFLVLLDGSIELTQRVRGGEVELARTDYRGAYAGAVQAYVGDRMPQVYLVTAHSPEGGTFFVLPAAVFGRVMREWFPMAIHLLDGLWLARQNADVVVGQRERLLALGQLSAGLTHELNNPAAAAGRAVAGLREQMAGLRAQLAPLARPLQGSVPESEAVAAGQGQGAGALQRLAGLQETLAARAAQAPRLPPLELNDREDELADWLDEHDVDGSADGTDLAGVYAAAGLDPACLEEVAGAVDPAVLEPALRWLAHTLEAESLLREIEDATSRISSLLASVRQYSYMDRTPYESVDLREGLESTLAILGHKLGPGVHVVRDYDPGLPRVPAYGGELNQVWTNLIDNALGAMGGEGTLTLRARRGEGDGADGGEGGSVVVEVGDTGPGVPEELRSRIFEPFFTTKPVGEGTGLGLDISYRIVVSRHGGDLRVESAPGDTRFVVRLPVRPKTS